MSEYVVPVPGYARPFYEALHMPRTFSHQERSGNWLAILSTNEQMNQQRVSDIRNSPAAPNGYIVGAGLGNIFAMAGLFPDGQPPKGIVCTDIMPEVVLVGRAFIKSLKKSQSMEETVGRLKGFGSIPLYTSVIHEEKDSAFRKRLVSAIPYVVDWMKMAQSTTGAALEAVKRNFPVLKGLAQADQIVMTYASLTDQSWLDYVQMLPDWSSLRNVVYGSNVIDHATNRGRCPEEIAGVNDAFAELRGESEKNWFADTNEGVLQYHLRIRQEPPFYNGSDFRYAP